MSDNVIGLFVFNPFVNDSRVLKEAYSLKKMGYDVYVVAHLDNDLQKEEVLNEIKIIRLSYLNRRKMKKFKKLIAYIKYIIESVNFAKKLPLIHCNDLNTLPIAYLVKKLYNRNVKIVYDAHEYETEINGLKGVKKAFIRFLEKWLIKYADAVITVSNSIAEEYKRLYSIKKPTLVLNTPSYINIDKKELFRETFEIKKEKVVFLYQGGFSSGRGIEIILETFANIGEKNNVLVLMGYGEQEDLVKEYAAKYENIFFHKAVSPEVLIDYTSSADFGISLIEDTCLSYRYCLPNKIFEYVMAELPVIVSNLYEMKNLVESNNIGIVAKENTPQALSDAIKAALNLDKEILKKNLKKAKKIYNWQEQEKKLSALYNDLII